MGNSEENIRSKLEQFEPNVSPSMAEIKRFNEGLDLIAKKPWVLRYWWVLLLLLLLLLSTNFWYLLNSNNRNERIIAELKNEIAANNIKDETTHPKLERVYRSLDTLNRAFKNVTEQNKALIDKIADLEDKIGLYQNTPMLGFYNGSALTLNKGNSTGNKRKSNKIDLVTNFEKAPKEKVLNRKSNTDFASKAGKEKSEKVKREIVFDSMAIDSFTKDIIEKIAEKQKSNSVSEKIETPHEANWFGGIEFRTGIQNTYFVNGQTPLAVSAIGGFSLNRFYTHVGLGYRYLSFDDVSTSSLKAEIDEIGDVPPQIAANAEELYSSSHSLILPVGISYQLGNSGFYGGLGTSLHLYSFQTFTIEANDDDLTLNKRHPEIQFFNYRLGFGKQFQLGSRFGFNVESGFTFGNPNFDLLIRERSGGYMKVNFLFY